MKHVRSRDPLWMFFLVVILGCVVTAWLQPMLLSPPSYRYSGINQVPFTPPTVGYLSY